MRAMAERDAPAVVGMVRGLAREAGGRVEPKVTPESLWHNRHIASVTVAETTSGALLGACITETIFSTWRGTRGAYVVDLFVDPACRGLKVGERLLRAAARRARTAGAEFIKLEVDIANPGAARFYERLGFACYEFDRAFVLEREALFTFTDQRD